jgi:hypothetical protein
MSFILLCTISLAAGAFDCAAADVHSALQRVLLERNIVLKESFPQEIITEKSALDIELLENYVADNQPDENPGWTQAHFSLYVRFCEIDANETEVVIEAFFERYGTRSALMLIPPSWVPVPSNGFLEEEILHAIEKRLAETHGGKQ